MREDLSGFLKFNDKISLLSTTYDGYLEADWFGESYFPIVTEHPKHSPGQLPKHFERCVFMVVNAEDEGILGGDHSRLVGGVTDTDSRRLVTYGQYIKLLNVDSNRYLRVDIRDEEVENKFRVILAQSSSRNDSNEVFKFIPRYKVREEGEKVRLADQVLIANVASGGWFLHSREVVASDSYSAASLKSSIMGKKQSNKKMKHLVDLHTGMIRDPRDPAGTHGTRTDKKSNSMFHTKGLVWCVLSYSSSDVSPSELQDAIKGGEAVMIFHKEAEGFLTVDMEIDDSDSVCQKGARPVVYFDKRIVTKATYNVSDLEHSSNALWLIEYQKSNKGGVVMWSRQTPHRKLYRLKHLATGKYLSIQRSNRTVTNSTLADQHRARVLTSADFILALTKERDTQDTLLSLHPLDEVLSDEYVTVNSYARLQFYNEKVWLHALPDFYPPSKNAAPSPTRPYLHRQKTGVSTKPIYEDVFAIRRASDDEKHNLNVIVSMAICLKGFVTLWKNLSHKLQHIQRLEGTGVGSSSHLLVEPQPAAGAMVRREGRGRRGDDGQPNKGVKDAIYKHCREQFFTRHATNVTNVLKTLIFFCTMHIHKGGAISQAAGPRRARSGSRAGNRRRSQTHLRRGSFSMPNPAAPGAEGTAARPSALLQGASASRTRASSRYGAKNRDQSKSMDPFTSTDTPIRKHQLMLFDQNIHLLTFALLQAPLRVGLSLDDIARANRRDEELTDLNYIYQLAYRLLEQMVKGSKDLAVQFREYIPFIESHLGYTLQVTGALMQICKDNIVILNKLTHEQIASFISLIPKCGRDPRYLDLLSALCVCDGKGFKRNQDIIGRLLQMYDASFQILFPTKCIDDTVYIKPVKVLPWFEDSRLASKRAHRYRDNDGDLEDWLSLADFATYSDGQSSKVSLVKYYERQLVLFANLCTSGNVDTKRYVKKMISKRTLLAGVKDSFSHGLGDSIRAAFVTLAVNLYVLKHPPDDLSDMFTDKGVRVRYWYKWTQWLRLAQRGKADAPRFSNVPRFRGSGPTPTAELLRFTGFAPNDDKTDGSTTDDDLEGSYAALSQASRTDSLAEEEDIPNKEFFNELKRVAFEFLKKNVAQQALMMRRNALITEILKMSHHFIQMDYYEEDEIHALLEPMLELLDTRNDVVPGATQGYSSNDAQIDPRWANSERNKLIMETKLEAVKILKTLFESESTDERDEVDMEKYYHHNGLATMLFELLNYRDNMQLINYALKVLFRVLSRKKGQSAEEDDAAITEFAVILKNDLMPQEEIDKHKERKRRLLHRHAKKHIVGEGRPKSYVRTRNVIRYFREAPEEDSVTIALLRVFTQLINLYDDDDEQKLYMQCQLDLLGITPLMSLLIESKHENVVKHALDFGISLLEGGNKQVQDGLVEYFQSLTDEAFFACIHRRIKNAVNQIREHKVQEGRGGPAVQSRDDDSLSITIGWPTPEEGETKLPPSYEFQQNNLYHVRETLRLIQLFCEGHNLELQNYLREQEDNVHSCDLVKETMNFLKAALSVPEIDEYMMEIILQTFNSLTEYCQGPCASNQACLVNSNIGSEVMMVFKQDFGKSTRTENDVEKNNEEMVASIRSAAVTTLLALLEGCSEQYLASILTATLNIESLKQTLTVASTKKDDQSTQLGFNIFILIRTLQSFDATGQAFSGIDQYLDDMRFNTLTGRIEISRDGILEKVYFRIPEICSNLPESAKKALLYDVNRETPTARIADFFDRLDDVIYEIEYHDTHFGTVIQESDAVGWRGKREYLFHKFKRFVNQRRSLWESGITYFGLINNLVIVFLFEATDSEESKVDHDDGLEHEPFGMDDVRPSSWIFSLVLYVLAYCLLACNFCIIVNFMVSEAPLLAHQRWKEEKKKKHQNQNKQVNNNTKDDPRMRREIRRAKMEQLRTNEHKLPALKMSPLYGEDCAVPDAARAGSLVQLGGVATRVVSGGGMGSTLARSWGSLSSMLSFVRGSNDHKAQDPANGPGDKDAPEDELADEWAGEERVQSLRYVLRTVYTQSQFCYLVIMLVCAFFGVAVSPFFLTIHLLYIVKTIPLLQNVIHSITRNSKSLLYTGFLAAIIVYIFSAFGFLFFRQSFLNEHGPDSKEDYHCDTLLRCFVYQTVHGIRAGGGIGEIMSPPQWGKPWNGARLAYDISFFIMVIVILLNIVFGIIVDTFAELRAERSKIEDDIRNTCFICSMEASEFDRHAQGFEHHIKYDHNMWMYIFFVHHLRKKPEDEFTGQESYVKEKIKRADLSWFPMNKAMCLLKSGDDDGDNVQEKMRREMNERFMFTEERLTDVQLGLSKEIAEISNSLSTAMSAHASDTANQLKELIHQLGATSLPGTQNGLTSAFRSSDSMMMSANLRPFLPPKVDAEELPRSGPGTGSVIIDTPWMSNAQWAQDDSTVPATAKPSPANQGSCALMGTQERSATPLSPVTAPSSPGWTSPVGHLTTDYQPAAGNLNIPTANRKDGYPNGSTPTPSSPSRESNASPVEPRPALKVNIKTPHPGGRPGSPIGVGGRIGQTGNKGSASPQSPPRELRFADDMKRPGEERGPPRSHMMNGVGGHSSSSPNPLSTPYEDGDGETTTTDEVDPEFVSELIGYSFPPKLPSSRSSESYTQSNSQTISSEQEVPKRKKKPKKEQLFELEDVEHAEDDNDTGSDDSEGEEEGDSTPMSLTPHGSWHVNLNNSKPPAAAGGRFSPSPYHFASDGSSSSPGGGGAGRPTPLTTTAIAAATAGAVVAATGRKNITLRFNTRPQK